LSGQVNVYLTGRMRGILDSEICENEPV